MSEFGQMIHACRIPGRDLRDGESRGECLWSLADLDLFVVVACVEHCFDVGAEFG